MISAPDGPIFIIFAFALLIAVAIPMSQILHRTGFSRAWILVLFVPLPLVPLVFFWIYAFMRWPVEGEKEGEAAKPQ